MKKLFLVITLFSLPSIYAENDSIRMKDIRYLRPLLKGTPLEGVSDDIRLTAIIRVCEENSALLINNKIDCHAIQEILVSVHSELSKNKNIPHDTLERVIETTVSIEKRAILDSLNYKINKKHKDTL